MTQLAPLRMNLSEHQRNIWAVVPEHDTPFEAILEERYWAHVSAKLRPWDRLEVMAEDGSYFAELIVQDAGRLYAKVALLRKVDLTAVEVTASRPTADGYFVKWSGPHTRWRVQRKNDVLKDGFAIRDQAEQWLSNHLKAVA